MDPSLGIKSTWYPRHPLWNCCFSWMSLKHDTKKGCFTKHQVFWLPKMNFQEVLHVKQTTPNILGSARLGDKLGVRCKASFAEQVHGCIKPGGSFLPPGKKSLYLLGPLPFGTVRDSLIELLASISWTARPLQPVAAAAHANSVVWKIQFKAVVVCTR